VSAAQQHVKTFTLHPTLLPLLLLLLLLLLQRLLSMTWC
jgi:hypothetical protein